MRKFFSIKLKHYNNQIPLAIAKSILIEESNLIKYLWKHNAIEFRYNERTSLLRCFGEPKHLTMAKLMYPHIFETSGKMGFIELYIQRILRRKLEISKGST